MPEPRRSIEYLSDPQKWHFLIAVPLKRQGSPRHAVAFLNGDKSNDKPLVLVEDANVYLTTLDGIMLSEEGERRIREEGIHLTPQQIAERGWRVD